MPIQKLPVPDIVLETGDYGTVFQFKMNALADAMARSIQAYNNQIDALETVADFTDIATAQDMRELSHPHKRVTPLGIGQALSYLDMPLTAQQGFRRLAAGVHHHNNRYTNLSNFASFHVGSATVTGILKWTTPINSNTFVNARIVINRNFRSSIIVEVGGYAREDSTITNAWVRTDADDDGLINQVQYMRDGQGNLVILLGDDGGAWSSYVSGFVETLTLGWTGASSETVRNPQNYTLSIADSTAGLTEQVTLSGADIKRVALDGPTPANNIDGTIPFSNLPFSAEQMSQWSQAYNWGYHGSAGYVLLDRSNWGQTGLGNTGLGGTPPAFNDLNNVPSTFGAFSFGSNTTSAPFAQSGSGWIVPRAGGATMYVSRNVINGEDLLYGRQWNGSSWGNWYEFWNTANLPDPVRAGLFQQSIISKRFTATNAQDISAEFYKSTGINAALVGFSNENGLRGRLGVQNNGTLIFTPMESSASAFSVNQSGNVSFGGTMNRNTSDARWKLIHGPLVVTQKQLDSIGLYYYQWIVGIHTGSEDSGIIAQEVQKVFPHCCDLMPAEYDENGQLVTPEKLTVDWGKFASHYAVAQNQIRLNRWYNRALRFIKGLF